MSALKEHFDTPEKTYAAISDAREYFGEKDTTFEMYDELIISLGFCLLHCPDGLQDLVYSTIQEASWRQLGTNL